MKQTTQTHLKSSNKLQLNSSPVFSKTKLSEAKAKHGATKESKLTLHAVVIFWVKTNKTKKTPSQHSLTTITRENYTSRTYFSHPSRSACFFFCVVVCVSFLAPSHKSCGVEGHWTYSSLYVSLTWTAGILEICCSLRAKKKTSRSACFAVRFSMLNPIIAASTSIPRKVLVD